MADMDSTDFTTEERQRIYKQGEQFRKENPNHPISLRYAHEQKLRQENGRKEREKQDRTNKQEPSSVPRFLRPSWLSEEYRNALDQRQQAVQKLADARSAFQAGKMSEADYNTAKQEFNEALQAFQQSYAAEAEKNAKLEAHLLEESGERYRRQAKDLYALEQEPEYLKLSPKEKRAIGARLIGVYAAHSLPQNEPAVDAEIGRIISELRDSASSLYRKDATRRHSNRGQERGGFSAAGSGGNLGRIRDIREGEPESPTNDSGRAQSEAASGERAQGAGEAGQQATPNLCKKEDIRGVLGSDWDW